jgi:signal transduction histidine kinase
MVARFLRDESQRLNETLSNFLVYARPRELKLGRGDLNGLVGEVCRMVESNRDLLKEIRLAVSLDEALEPFPFDADQIRQVVWNIVLNAIQAMEGLGTLTIETSFGQSWAFFRVKDTGPGIPESRIAQIFKPFHTTKHQGTGLGLAIADRIVKAHGGRIDVESRGRGATFTVSLPAIEE